MAPHRSPGAPRGIRWGGGPRPPRGIPPRVSAFHRPSEPLGMPIRNSVRLMADLTARKRGAACVLAFDLVGMTSDPRLVALFEEHNVRHFDASLPLVPVRKGIPEDAERREDLNGTVRLQVRPRPGVPSLATVTIYLAHELFDVSWGSEDDRWAKIADTLLHQMVHLAVDVDALGGAHPFEDHHGRHFTEECNRIGARAGWGQVRASAEGVMPNDDAAEWPDNAIERAGAQ